MNIYAKQWETLNNNWPKDNTLVDVVYEPDTDDGMVLRNVNFMVTAAGEHAFITQSGVVLSDENITGWNYVG